jgi:hypothetical protein
MGGKMKRLAFLVLALFLTFELTAARAEPFLVCDPQADVVVYGLKWVPTDVWQEVLAEADTRIRKDLAPLPPGNYPNAEIRAGRQYLLDGQPQDVYVWGPSRPFALEKPAIAGEAAGIALEAPL